MALLEIIHERIRREGPISIADYMALALCHPDYGYYMKADPFGAAGDFTTAPEISQLFGEMLGVWLAECWLQAGSPQGILVELGPGRGTLMADLLRATRHVPKFHESLSLHLVEISPALRAMQKEKLKTLHPSIHWHDDISSLQQMPLFFVANEFFDALPIRQFLGDEERRIGLEQGELCFTLPADNVQESCISGEEVMTQLAAHIHSYGGAGLVVDYGYVQGRGDSLQALKNHAFHNPLQQPGEADITAHVNFGLLKTLAEKAGLTVPPIIGQGAFLSQLGVIVRAQALCAKADEAQRARILSGLERLTSADAMGSLFKVLMVQK